MELVKYKERKYLLKIWLVKWNLALYLSHLSCVERRYMDDYYEYTSRQPKQSFICLSKFNA
jgi:hypothetical protein